MTENDYIAEYIKEKRPEIIDTLDYRVWKVGRVIGDSVRCIINNIGLGNTDSNQTKEECEDDIQGNETEHGTDNETGI